MKIHYVASDIGRFKIGAVVEIYQGERWLNPRMIGHVTGFGLNDYREVCILVKLATGEENLFHPVRLEVL